MTSEGLHTSFRVKLVKPTELLLERNLLHNLNKLINEVYDSHHRLSTDPDPLFDTKRIQSEEQLIQELGDDGLVALLFDDSLEEEVGEYGKLVATGAIKPWTGTLVDAFSKGMLVNGEKMAKSSSAGHTRALDASSTWDWEVATCASVDAPKYRKTGLVTRCVDALLQDLVIRRDKRLSIADENSKRLPIKFWVSALVDVSNQEYWLRRGYEMEGSIQKGPKGIWNAKRDFQIATLSKVVA